MWVFRGWRKLLNDLPQGLDYCALVKLRHTYCELLAVPDLMDSKRQRAFRCFDGFGIDLCRVIGHRDWVGLLAVRLKNEKANVIKQKRIAQEETCARSRISRYSTLSGWQIDLRNFLPRKKLFPGTRRASALSQRGMHEKRSRNTIWSCRWSRQM